MIMVKMIVSDDYCNAHGMMMVTIMMRVIVLYMMLMERRNSNVLSCFFLLSNR